jgi:hypothetical protein
MWPKVAPFGAQISEQHEVRYITHLLRECRAFVSRLSRVCFANVARLHHECCAFASRMSRVCFSNVARLLREARLPRECRAFASRLSRVCIAKVARLLRECRAFVRDPRDDFNNIIFHWHLKPKEC